MPQTPPSPRPGTAQLFVTCLVDSLAPRVGEAVVAVLERLGWDVEFAADQTCCGQPAYNVGRTDDAGAIAKHTVSVLDATEGPIVVPSGSCAAMLAIHVPEMLDGDPAAGRVAGRIREFTRFVVDLVPPGGWPEVDAEMTYHPGCHGLRELGLRSEGERLVDAVASTRCPLPGADECCGFGGLFSIELPEVSAAMMTTKLDNVVSTGAGVLVGGDVGCLMHLAGGLRRRQGDVRVRHIAELLAEGLRE